MNSMQKKRILFIGVFCLLAFCTRLLPLSISQYPYNNDSITECRIAEDILASGTLDYPDGSYYVSTHSEVTPVFDAFLAFLSAAIGFSPYFIAQIMIAIFSVVTILTFYVMALRISRSYVGAATGTVVLALLGTFVFLTGSAWKESLGISLLIILIYSYMNRIDKRFLILELLLLLMLPLTHHLVTAIAYMALGFLTTWSVIFALVNHKFTRTHVIDISILSVSGLLAFFYYQMSSFDRLSYLDTWSSTFGMAAVFILLGCLTYVVLNMKTHSKLSFAIIPSAAVFLLFSFDYLGFVFPYESDGSLYVLILVVCYCAVIFFAWGGFEKLIERRSIFCAIPLGLLLPFMTLASFGLILGIDLVTHQMLYRAFDFADISLALGVTASVSFLSESKMRKYITVAIILALLLLSFPFGYYTNSLLGIRHDTQAYEIDAIDWAAVTIGSDEILQGDERLAYIARATHDFEKRSDLVFALANLEYPSSRVFNMYLEEWSVIGVNNYPFGHPILDESHVNMVIESSSVYYVGGPASNTLTLFELSLIGKEVIAGS